MKGIVTSSMTQRCIIIDPGREISQSSEAF